MSEYILSKSYLLGGKTLKDRFASYPDLIHPLLEKIVSNENIEKTLSNITNQIGKISIQKQPCECHDAIWDCKEKTIQLDPDLFLKNEINVAAHIIFEIYNANQTQHIQNAFQNAKNVEAFVETIEHIEHQSALMAKKTIKEIFGSQAISEFDYTYDDFHLHYTLQQIQGHSEWLANIRFPTNKYRGTLFCPLSDLDTKNRKCLYSLMFNHIRATQEKDPKQLDIFKSKINRLKDLSNQDPSFKNAYDCAIKLFETFLKT